jgi:hypothetical protein
VVGQSRFLTGREGETTYRKPMQITSRHGPAGKATILALRRLLHYFPPSTQDPAMPLSSLIRRPCSIPNSSPILMRNTETKMQTAREGSNIRQLFHRTGPTSCDTTSKLGKSERGAVRAMVRGPCWLAWVFSCASPRCPFVSLSRPRHTKRRPQFGPS